LTARLPCGRMQPLDRVARAAAAGDGAALEAFAVGVYDPVRRLCAALVDSSSAEDLAQEAMLRALRALPRYRAQASARTWTLTIAHHTCMDELRRRSRERRRDALATAGDIPVGPEPDEEVAITDAIARLDVDRREAFVLTQIIGLSYAEAAAICGCPTGTIRSRVARARQDLAAALTAPDRHACPPHDADHTEARRDGAPYGAGGRAVG